MTLHDILEQRSIQTSFQPIVLLETGEVRAYEALSRGPAGELESPLALFRRAEAEGLVARLDLLCWEIALMRADSSPAFQDGEARLFMNLLPETLGHRDFLPTVHRLLDQVSLPPRRIVLEVTEGQRIDDFPQFARILAPLRRLGLGIALDDVGAGHAGLQTLVEVEPDIVKIDRSLVQGIDLDRGRKAVMEAMVLVARRSALEIIAEGIESAEELDFVRNLGVDGGQGYFIGRPQTEIAPPRPESIAVMRRGLSEPGDRPTPHFDRQGPSVGSFIESAPVAPRDLGVAQALQLFEKHDIEVLVVVDDDGPPWGILHRSRLLEVLARPFGRELYLRRTIESIATTDLLIVDHDARLEHASRLAMSRPDHAVYDVVIVVGKEGQYLGLVSVRQLLDAITDFRVEVARYANPLTGLPGNPVIETTLRSRLKSRGAVGLLHADLDDFKAYNDAYGFHRGDDAIRFTAELLAEVIGEVDGEEALLGHVGGDDFVAIVRGASVRSIAGEVGRRFRERVGMLYSDADRARGYIVARSRSGSLSRSPLMGVTVATTLVDGRDDRHYTDVLDRLASEKRAAKVRSKEGRSLVLEAAAR